MPPNLTNSQDSMECGYQGEVLSFS